MINITNELANDPVIQRFVRECPERFTDIMETAINKAAQRIRYLVKKEVPNKWGVSKEELKDFHLKRAMRGHGELVAAAILRGASLPLFKFQNVTPRNPMTGKTSGGVSVMIAGQSQRFKNAFVAKMGNNHTGIFERTGEFGLNKKGVNREHIRELFSSAVTGMAASDKTKIPEKIAPMIQEEFETHFKREAESWLSLLGAK
jgi:hypothetical protein